MPRASLFYGWWIVAAGFGIEFLVGALIFHAYGAYAVLLREEFGWDKTVLMLSAAFAMSRAESGILGPVQGWLTDRFGPRALIRVGMGIFGVGFLLFSRIDGPVVFFLTFFMMAVGSSLGGYLPVSVAIVTWFRRRRAQALSISGMGMATGGLLAPLLAAFFSPLTRFGWRWTAVASGLLVLAIGVPLAQVVRNRPEAYGLSPDGRRAPPRRRGATGRHAQLHGAPGDGHSRLLVHLARPRHGALLVVSAVMVHMIIHVTERLGYTLHQAGAVVALLTIMQGTGQLSGGWLGDLLA